jgi:hypothetical protein
MAMDVSIVTAGLGLNIGSGPGNSVANVDRSTINGAQGSIVVLGEMRPISVSAS